VLLADVTRLDSLPGGSIRVRSQPFIYLNLGFKPDLVTQPIGMGYIGHAVCREVPPGSHQPRLQAAFSDCRPTPGRNPARWLGEGSNGNLSEAGSQLGSQGLTGFSAAAGIWSPLLTSVLPVMTLAGNLKHADSATGMAINANTKKLKCFFIIIVSFDLMVEAMSDETIFVQNLFPAAPTAGRDAPFRCLALPLRPTRPSDTSRGLRSPQACGCLEDTRRLPIFERFGD